MSENNKNQQDTISRFDKLAIDISNDVSSQLAELMSNLLNTVQDTLLEMSDEAEKNEKVTRYEKQTRYSELITEVRILKPTIETTFNKKIKEVLLPAEKLDPEQEEQEAIDDELSLMDNDIMETRVLIEGISNHAWEQYREQLAYLDVRLEYLAIKTTKIFKKSALMPVNFCQAFADTLADNFNNADKTLLFSIFNVEIVKNLGPLYDSVNDQLVEGNILPEIKLHIQAPTSQQGSSEDATDGGYSGGADSAGMGGDTGSAGSEEYQHYTSGMPASEVGRVIGDYIGVPLTPKTADKSSDSYAEYFPPSTKQQFGHQEIIQALSHIQNLPQFDHPEGDRFDSEAIKQAILSEIAKTSGGATTRHINQIAEKTIDFIELIFDAIIEDANISDTIKALLLRLQIPVIKASMSDQEFFIYDEHPARILLDTVADVGVGITEHADELYIYLDKIITGILGEYELSTDTFQAALDNLNAYIEEQEAITRAKEEEEQKQLLRKHARTTVLKTLRAITTGKILPEDVHPLILKRWPTLMFNHYLSNGKENDEWINIVLTLRHIVENVQPITSAESLAKHKSEKDTMAEKIEEYLNASSNSQSDVENIVTTFLTTVQANIDNADFTEEEVSDAEETISKAGPVEEPPIEEEVIDKPEIPANLKPGMWFQVYMGENKTPRRCKLSVIIIEDANLMFVNHKGELVIEKSFDEFNKEVSNNSTTMIMGHSAFDHAFKTVITRLN